MATLQLVKPVEQAQLVAQATSSVSQTQSLMLLRNLLRASISEICFLRHLLPGVTAVKTLKQTIGGDHAAEFEDHVQRIQDWQDAAFDALEKGYLRTMMFGVYDANMTQLLESYVFNFSYPTEEEDAVVIQLQNDARTYAHSRLRESSITMLRMVQRICGSMNALPSERAINVKLFYYDDKVPATYKPKGFRDATYEKHGFFAAPPLKIQLGKVATPSHSMSLKLAYMDESSPDEADASLFDAEDGMQMRAADTTMDPEEAAATMPVPMPIPIPEGVDVTTFAAATALIAQAAHAETAEAQAQAQAQAPSSGKRRKPAAVKPKKYTVTDLAAQLGQMGVVEVEAPTPSPAEGEVEAEEAAEADKGKKIGKGRGKAALGFGPANAIIDSLITQGLLKKYGRGRYETVPSELDRLEAIAQAAQAQAQAEAAAAAAKQQAAETLAAAEPQEVAAPITPFQATVYAAIKELIPAAMAKAPAPHYVTEAALAVLAGVDGAGTSLKAGKAEGRALARALVEAGVLAADATGPKGRAVVIKGEAAEALYAEAVAALEAYVPPAPIHMIESTTPLGAVVSALNLDVETVVENTLKEGAIKSRKSRGKATPLQSDPEPLVHTDVKPKLSLHAEAEGDSPVPPLLLPSVYNTSTTAGTPTSSMTDDTAKPHTASKGKAVSKRVHREEDAEAAEAAEEYGVFAAQVSDIEDDSYGSQGDHAAAAAEAKTKPKATGGPGGKKVRRVDGGAFLPQCTVGWGKASVWGARGAAAEPVTATPRALRSRVDPEPDWATA